MDVLYFLKDRTQSSAQYYETAGEPFREIMRKIEAGEAPFDDIEFFPEDEPPFQAEWSQANTSLEVLGRSCVSMLSASLKLYFQTWESELGIKWAGDDKERKKYFENGFVEGYKQCFGEVLKISWADCPVDFDLLEQVTLARNDGEHPDSITTLDVQHKPKTRAKFPSLFFLSDTDRAMYSMHDFPINSWFFQPTVYVSREQLLTAIEHVELLGVWLEDRMSEARFPRRNSFALLVAKTRSKAVWLLPASFE
jgi:hypothetical protein